MKTGASTPGIAAAQSSAESWLPSDRRNISLSITVRPDNGDDRTHLVVPGARSWIPPQRGRRLGACAGCGGWRRRTPGSRARPARRRRRSASARCRGGCGLMVRVLASSLMGSRAVISAGAGCCRAERAGQRVIVFADKGRVLRSVTVTGHGVVAVCQRPHNLNYVK